jgi:hypothetical protein
MERCYKSYGSELKWTKSESNNIVKEIQKFCLLLKNNKGKTTEDYFLTLPKLVQCLFLYYADMVLKNKEKYSKTILDNASNLFRIFNKKGLNELDIFIPYKNVKVTKSKEPKKKVSKNFDDKNIKFEMPNKESSSYIFYTTLYQQKENSPLAITWLTEHGVYKDDSSIWLSLTKKYIKLKDSNKLIK